MIRLKKKNVEFADTPLIEGLYVIKDGSMLQIRIRESQVVMSAVTEFEELVRCGRLLVERYRTVERLRKKLAEGDYINKVPEGELVRRCSEEKQALVSKLQKDWYKAVTGESEEVKEKIPKPKRIGIKLKKVATGQNM